MADEPVSQMSPDPNKVPILDPYGNLGTIDKSEADQALTKGFKYPSSDQVKDYLDSKTYGEGMGSAVKATTLGFLRGATANLSDPLLSSVGLTDSEEIKALQKHRPGLSAAGEVAGVVSGIAAPEALGASKLLTPAGAISEMGNAVTHLVTPAAETVAGKIAAGAVGHGIGSAVEGAAFGLGQSVSDAALGDPDLSAEKVIANIGHGALWGGAIGTALGSIGGAYGAAKGKLADTLPKFVSEGDKAAIEAGNFEAAVRNSDLPDKEGIIDGLGKLKPNSGSIIDAAELLDNAPVLPGQISSNNLVQKGQAALLEGPPTYAAIKQQQLATEGFNKASKAVEGALGAETEHTAASLGNALKESLTNKLNSFYKPIKDIYDSLGFDTIPLSERSTPAIARNITKLDEVRISPSSPEAALAKRVAKEIPNLKTVEDVKNYKAILNRSVSATASSGEKRMAAILADKLTELEENSVIRFAQNEMKTPQAKEKIMSLLDQREVANAGYTIFRDKMSRLGEILGKRKIYGAQDFLNFLDDLTPEKVSGKLFAKGNSEFMQWFSKEFPEESRIVGQYQKSLIKESALKDGALNTRMAIKQIDKLSPEIKNVLFNEGELKRVEAAKTYLESFPAKFNPSETSNADAFRAFFESPTGAVIGNVRDAAISKFIGAASKTSDETAQRVAKLSYMESLIRKTTSKVTSLTKSVFKTGEEAIPALGGFFGSQKTHEEKQEDFKKITSQINEYKNNPESLINTVHSIIEPVHDTAPNVSQALAMSVSRAMAFLSQKLPTTPDAGPLDEEYSPSHSEVLKFHHYMDIIDDPTLVLHEVKHGVVTQDSIEALSTVYPSLYAEMKSKMIEQITDMGSLKSKPKIPYQVRISISQFLKEDLDPGMKSANILANQLSMQPRQNQDKPGGAAPGGAQSLPAMNKMKLATRMDTPMQAVNRREA